VHVRANIGRAVQVYRQHLEQRPQSLTRGYRHLLAETMSPKPKALALVPGIRLKRAHY
jgi:hypothetical protein